MRGSDYVVDVMDRGSYQRVRDALADATVLSKPTRLWLLSGDHFLEPAPKLFEPSVSLGSRPAASRRTAKRY